MVLWILTAGIGGYLLAAGFAAQRARAGVLQPREQPVAVDPAGVLGVVPEPGAGPAPARMEVEGSPLLEFTHPALALTGLTLWIFYTVSGDRLFGWIGFGIVLAAILAGISWVLMGKRTGRGHPGFPDHLVLLHGVAALCTLALVAVCLFAVVHL